MNIKTINTECTPEMLRAAALNSELGDYARNNLSGAWDLIIELWDVMVKAAIAVEQDLPQHYDDTAVVMFANAMKQKMAAKRNQGYSGWNDKEYCTTEKLQKMLIDHLAKGDPVDIGNFAMMLWSRGESVAAVEVEPSGRKVLRNVFALCEETEDLETNTPNDFMRGRKFEAKAIRNAIGAWFSDECNSRKAAPAVEPVVKDSLTTESGPLVQSTAPTHIWLQHSDSDLDNDEPFPYGSNVSWCEDQINNSDIQYVRVDLIEQANPDTVPIPQSADQAELMQKSGYAYLQQHAPERLVKAEPVAWGFPNTAISGKNHALMIARLEVPSDDQYAGALWLPLYLNPINAETRAIVLELCEAVEGGLINTAELVADKLREKLGAE